MDWCEICRTGEFQAKNGKMVKITEDDLNKIVTEFSSQDFPAPIVIGHPKDNSPAFGWLDQVKKEGNKLFAKYKDVVPEFAELVNQKVYPNRSISLYPDFKIKHVGFLGGAQPAVKGLAAYQFSEDDDAEIIEFSDASDWKFRTIGNIFQDLRDFLIEKYDVETADKLISAWRIEDLKTVETAEAAIAFCEVFEKTEEPEPTADEEPKPEELPATELPAEFSEQISAQNARITDLEAQLKQKELEAKKKEHIDFCEGLIKEGRLAPANRTAALNLLELASSTGVYEFSEGGEADAEGQVKQFLKSSPKVVEFGEVDEDDIDTSKTIDFSDGAAVAEAITTYQNEQAAKGRKISVTKALKELKGDK